MVKRFTFEASATGKVTSIISDEPGSKLVILSGSAQPVVKIEQLKGKAETPELAEFNLADLIDVKGMKAMGNRLSAHAIQTISLIAEHDDEQDVPDPAPDSVEDTLPDPPEEPKPVRDVVPEKAVEPAEEVKPKEPEPVEPDQPKPVKNISFEITNPDDVNIDDKGQLGLFGG